MTKGTLYAVGIGPGDPELMTLKAVRLINESPVVCVPRGREDGESVAMGIVARTAPLDGKRIIDVHFPMKKGSQRDALTPAAREVLAELDSGNDVVFITLGDPGIYSTFYHLHDALSALDNTVRVAVVPGVSSVTASAAAAGMSLTLAGERLAIVPAPYVEEIGLLIKEFDTVVLMKASRTVDKVRAMLREHGLLDRALFISRTGMEGEIIKPLADVTEDELNYFSIVIVRSPHE